MTWKAIPTWVLWAGGGSAAAFVIGMSSGYSTRYAIALTIAIGVTLVLTTREAWVLPVLVASVFVEILSVGGVTISRLIAPIALLIVLGTWATSSTRLGTLKPLFWVGAYSTWALASMLWTESLSGTVHQLSSLAIALIYTAAFATLLRSERDLRAVLITIAVAALCIGLFALAAYAVGFSSDLDEGRSAGGTGDPNFFANYQVVALPLVLVLASVTRRRTWRLGLYGVTLVIIASVLTSLSRGGIVTLLAVVLLLLVVPARRLYRSRAQKAAVVAIVIAASFVAFQTTANQLVPRIQTVFAGQDETTSTGRGSGRIDLWLAARTAFTRHPLTGIGYGAFPSQSNELMLQTPGVNLEVNEIGNIGHEAHSLFIGTAAELGVPGLIMMCGLLLSVGRSFVRTARLAREAQDEFLLRLSTGLLIALFAWVVASVFLSTETSRIVWILIGISLALPRLVSPARA
jgi:O-antigen ligase